MSAFSKSNATEELKLYDFTIKLILYDVVENLQKEKDEVMVVGGWEEEPGCAKCF